MNKPMDLDRINKLSVEIHADATVINDHFEEFMMTIASGGSQGEVAAQVLAGVSRDSPELLEDRTNIIAAALQDTDSYTVELHLLNTFEQLMYYDRHSVTDASTSIAAAAQPTADRPDENIQLAIESVRRLVKAGVPLSSEELNYVTATLDAEDDESVETAIEALAATVKEDHPGSDAALSIFVNRLTDQLVDTSSDDTTSTGITW